MSAYDAVGMLVSYRILTNVSNGHFVNTTTRGLCVLYMITRGGKWSRKKYSLYHFLAVGFVPQHMLCGCISSRVRVISSYSVESTCELQKLKFGSEHVWWNEPMHLRVSMFQWSSHMAKVCRVYKSFSCSKQSVPMLTSQYSEWILSTIRNTFHGHGNPWLKYQISINELKIK